jgi:DNA-binding NarL/FixJ family response regulator
VDTKLSKDLETLEFPPDAQNIEINYTAPSLLVPQRVRFRYKLEGFDKEWHDAGTRRQAFYSKLPPGTYTFRVTASNNDGLWSKAGASFVFTIPPSFTQSVLFKALCAVAVFGLLWLLYTIRLRQFTAQVKARLERDMQFVAEASNGLEAIEEFRKHRPDIALMDLEMPGVNGIDAMIAIRNEFPDARIIILTTYAGDVRISRALKVGARGYLLKSLLRKELLDTIRAVHAGQKRIPADLATQVADHVADDTLTLREIEVLKAIAAGKANKLIADKLSITEETVKGHVKNILSKLGANDRTHAVTIGLKRGIIEL